MAQKTESSVFSTLHCEQTHWGDAESAAAAMTPGSGPTALAPQYPQKAASSQTSRPQDRQTDMAPSVHPPREPRPYQCRCGYSRTEKTARELTTGLAAP